MKKRLFKTPSGSEISFTELGFGSAPIGNLYMALESGPPAGRVARVYPDDGHIAPVDLTMALRKGARAGGAEIHEQTAVTGVARSASGEKRSASSAFRCMARSRPAVSRWSSATRLNRGTCSARRSPSAARPATWTRRWSGCRWTSPGSPPGATWSPATGSWDQGLAASVRNTACRRTHKSRCRRRCGSRKWSACCTAAQRPVLNRSHKPVVVRQPAA